MPAINSAAWTGREEPPPSYSGPSWAQAWWLIRHGCIAFDWSRPWQWDIGWCWYDGPHYYLMLGPFVAELAC